MGEVTGEVIFFNFSSFSSKIFLLLDSAFLMV